MNKEEFLNELRKGLSHLPEQDADERVAFYSEMIDDRIEEGATEEEAVAASGSVEDIVLSETPLTKIVAEKIKPKRRLKGWEIALIILGFPLWLPLLIAAFAVILSLYIVIWSLIISLWAVEAALLVCAVAGLIGAVVFAINGNVPVAVASAGLCLLSAGLAIFMFYCCFYASKGILKLTKKALLGVKRSFTGKENTK
ncbi:MAG: DUF1700 domain-containing protein [Clostridia bacterium]|nr:DUF1700 domain-containing protein [Clostridia bacterium]